MNPPVLPPLCPMLTILDAKGAMNWYSQYLGASEIMRLVDSDGAVVHGEMRLWEAVIMLGEESPQVSNRSPLSNGNTSVVLNVIVEQGVDEIFTRALSGGASTVFPVADQFYGYRAGRFRDPYGHEWIISQRIEDVTEAEMQRRFDALLAGDSSMES